MRQQTRSRSLPSLFAVALLSALLLSGCATLFSGSSQDVRIESEPSEANIMVEGVKRGTTPATIDVTRPDLGDPPQIAIQKEGYEEKTLKLSKKFNAVTLLNILNGLIFAPVGFGVDWSTGALWKYQPENYTVELEQGSMSSMAPTSSKAKSYTLRNLPTDDDGNYVVPEHHGAVSVFDSETSTIYTFK